MTGDGFRYEPGRVARVVLDRPERRNSVTWEMMTGLVPVFDEVDQVDEVRCLVVEGAGGTYCAGTDLGGVSIERAADAMDVLSHAARFLSRLEALRKPVVSRIDGYCVGLGLEIALAGDVLVADPGAQFGFGEIKKGVLPAAAVARYRAWPRAHDLARLALTGDLIGAEDAYFIGLVDVLTDDTFAAVDDVAEKLAGAAPRSMELAKILLHRGAEDDYRTMAEAMPPLLLSEDVAEGTRAFFEKREPRFRGA